MTDISDKQYKQYKVNISVQVLYVVVFSIENYLLKKTTVGLSLVVI